MIINLKDIQEQFSYKVDKDGIKVTHNKPKRAIFLPYDSKNKEFFIKNGLGDFGRNIIDKNIKNIDFNEEHIIENIFKSLSNVPENKKSNLKLFFKELFFKDNTLQLVHTYLIFFLNTSTTHNTDIPKFLRDIFIDDEIKDIFNKLYDLKNYKLDILTNMLINSLGKLQEEKIPLKYYNKVPYLTKHLKKDLLFLLKNEQTFIEEIENFLTFYYFMYVSLLALEFNNQRKPDEKDEKGFFFLLKWEKPLKQRDNFSKGWNKLEKITEQLFTHRSLLEMLNYSSLYDGIPITYSELFEKIDALTEDEKIEYNSELFELRKWYNDSLEPFARKNETIENGCDFKDHINLLFEEIDYQFKNTTRKKPHSDYMKNIIDFAKTNFSKRGGSLGTILSINEPYILLLTKLCVGENNEIRLNELYVEFENRGVFLDKYSKEKLKEYFEKLNILDKKSDSGDAIYVKYIL